MTLVVPEPPFAVSTPTFGVVRRGGRLDLSRVEGHGLTNCRWLAPWLQRLLVRAVNAALPVTLESRLFRRCAAYAGLAALVVFAALRYPAVPLVIAVAITGWLALRLASQVASSPERA
jgi:hypothetical protein